MNRKAEQIVDTILADLLARKGIGNELEGIQEDDETYSEIYQTLIDKVEDILNG